MTATVTVNYERPKLTETELDSLVEYDMDEQDKFWLQAYNQNRVKDKQKVIDYDTFEFVMDRLEKEWFELTKDLPKQDPTNPSAFTDDQPCQICLDSECDNTNAIVFCDGCNLAVHQDCYGIPYIPEGQWLCRKCMISPEQPVSCIFCPNEGGAFKQTTNNKWAHLLCALWIPEVQIVNPVYMEPVDAIDHIPKSRWKLICSICKVRKGACIQCCHKFCFTAFHVTCARKEKYYMKIKDLLNVDDMRVYCARHRPRHLKGGSANYNNDSMILQEDMATIDMTTVTDGPEGVEGEQIEAETDEKSNRQSDIDTPMTMSANDDEQEDENERNENEARLELTKTIGQKRKASAISEEDLADTIKAARAHSHHFLTQAPMVPLYIGHRILQGLGTQVGQRSQFVKQICKYWALKRETRRGAPLLKRLHLEPWTAYASTQTESDKEKAEKYSTLVYLRADLEKIRLLTEMIRRREREKLRMAQLRTRYFEIVAFPLQLLMRQVVNTIQKRDIHNVFAEPVSIKDVPDYLSVIKEPIDFGTIKKKIESSDYQHLMNLSLVFSNASTYNKPITYYYKLAKRLQYASAPLLREMHKRAAALGVERVGDVMDRSIIDDILTTPDLSELMLDNEHDNEYMLNPDEMSPNKEKQTGDTKQTMKKQRPDRSTASSTIKKGESTTRISEAQQPQRYSHRLKGELEKPKPMLIRRADGRFISPKALLRKTNKNVTPKPKVPPATGTRKSSRVVLPSQEVKRTDNQSTTTRGTKDTTLSKSSSSSKEHKAVAVSEQRPSSKPKRASSRVSLLPGDLVWAKMPGFPWFPAELVQPSKSVPAAVMSYKEPDKDKLICFFDRHMKQRSWQWVNASGLQPFGRDDDVDLRHLKLTDYRRDKRRVRVSVRAAYIAACEAIIDPEHAIDPQRLLSRLK
ncbi:PHD-zinc-finger like domain-containing protein [Syncephalis fuscata]|nr:PHD-zinc-finger like domain-containing protein [Syncephalis fuscata]